MRTWYAIARTSDRAVVGLDQSYDPSDLGALAPGLERVEVTKSDWGAINENQHHAMNLPAWDCAADGTITPRADARFNLLVNQNDTVDVGTSHQIDFSLQDDQGAPAPVTATRQIIVSTPSGERRVNLSLVNGTATVNRTFTETGLYVISSADPATYRVSGTTKLNVGESW